MWSKLSRGIPNCSKYHYPSRCVSWQTRRRDITARPWLLHTDVALNTSAWELDLQVYGFYSGREVPHV